MLSIGCNIFTCNMHFYLFKGSQFIDTVEGRNPTHKKVVRQRLAEILSNLPNSRKDQLNLK